MKYHSTVGSGEFMKRLGFAKAAFHDLDDVVASPTAEWKRPWWVRRVDKPTVEIDWDNMPRFDGRKMPHASYAKYAGEQVAERLNRLAKKRTRQWILQNKSGFRLRDRAMDVASRTGYVDTRFLGPGRDADPAVLDRDGLDDMDKPNGAPERALRPGVLSPEEQGVPVWQGNPEENARMVRAVLRYFGADQVGFVELDEHTRKLVYSFDTMDGKAQVFENVDRAYETGSKLVIPNRAGWVIVFSVQMSEEVIKLREGRGPTALSASATGLAYTRARNIIGRLQNFLYALGYQGLMANWVNGLGIAPAFGVMAGLGELSRLNKMVSPEYGPLQRVFRVITDLPLAPTRPIDAGIMRFCRTCKKCAEACPAKALSTETEPTWEVVGPWNNPGHRAYFANAVKCSTWWRVNTVSCATCLAVCPFSRKDRSFIHKMVAPTVSATPLLNGFLTRMHGVFGYDTPRDPESWWGLDLPPHGINTVKGTQLE